MAARPWELIGGGDSALQEALTLANYADRVIIFHRGTEFSGQQTFQQRVLSHSKIDVRRQTAVEEILGDDGVTGVRVRNVANGRRIANRFERSFRLCGAGAEHCVSQKRHTVKCYGPRTDGYLDENRTARVCTPWATSGKTPRLRRLLQPATAPWLPSRRIGTFERPLPRILPITIETGGRMGKSEIGAARALLFVSCLVWIFGSAPDLYAQANFFQGKSIRVVRGGQPGDLYDLWTRLIAAILGKTYSRESQHHGAEHAGSRLGDRGKLCLQHRQAGRADARLAQFGHLHGPTDRP